MDGELCAEKHLAESYTAGESHNRGRKHRLCQPEWHLGPGSSFIARELQAQDGTNQERSSQMAENNNS